MFHKWEYKNIVAFVFLLAICLELTDTFIVNVAFPVLSTQLNTSMNELGWVINAYMLSIALIIPLCGWLGDKYGTKHIFMSALIIFTGASLMCGLSQSIEMLITARILQGLGAGMLVPVGQAMVFNAFPKHEIIKVMSMIALPAVIAPAASQVLGGIIVETLSWRWIFFVNVPICLCALWISKKYLINNVNKLTHKLNILEVMWGIFGFVFLFYALSCFEINKPITTALILFFCALLIIISYVYYSLQKKHPVLNLRIFLNPHFSKSMFVFVILMSTCMGSFLVRNYYYQETIGFTPFECGLMCVPFCLGMMSVMKPLPHWYAKYGPNYILLIGSLIFFIFNLLMIFVTSKNDFYFVLFLCFFQGLGQGVLGLVLESVAICSIKQQDMNHASSLLSMSWYLSVSFGVAFFSLLVSTMMMMLGVDPISFGSDHKQQIDVTFKTVFILSSVLYLGAGLFFFFKIDNEEIKIIAKEHFSAIGSAEQKVQH